MGAFVVDVFLKCLLASFWCVVTLVASGCVSGQIAPTKELLAHYNHAHVVAMEARPLGVPTNLTTLVPIGAAGGSMTAVRGIGVFNTIAIFLEEPEASERLDDASKSFQDMLDAEDVWIPTVVLAEEVSKQLLANGISSNVAQGVKLIPGVDNRRATFFMENWLAAIRAHYNDSGPVNDYQTLVSTQSLFVLEVGIINYEIYNGSLMLQVYLKMIDPIDGRVIGRSRASDAWNMPSLEPLDQLFTNDASRFKKVFSKTGRQFVKECLSELGL